MDTYFSGKRGFILETFGKNRFFFRNEAGGFFKGLPLFSFYVYFIGGGGSVFFFLIFTRMFYHEAAPDTF